MTCNDREDEEDAPVAEADRFRLHRRMAKRMRVIQVSSVMWQERC